MLWSRSTALLTAQHVSLSIPIPSTSSPLKKVHKQEEGRETRAAARSQSAAMATAPSRASLNDYLAFLAQRDEHEARERRLYDVVCCHLEQVFLAGLEEDDPNLFAFGTGERMRAAFEVYINRRADELQEPDAHTSAKQIMAAYDRAHSTSRNGDMLVRKSQ